MDTENTREEKLEDVLARTLALEEQIKQKLSAPSGFSASHFDGGISFDPNDYTQSHATATGAQTSIEQDTERRYYPKHLAQSKNEFSNRGKTGGKNKLISKPKQKNKDNNKPRQSFRAFNSQRCREIDRDNLLLVKNLAAISFRKNLIIQNSSALRSSSKVASKQSRPNTPSVGISRVKSNSFKKNNTNSVSSTSLNRRRNQMKIARENLVSSLASIVFYSLYTTLRRTNGWF